MCPRRGKAARVGDGWRNSQCRGRPRSSARAKEACSNNSGVSEVRSQRSEVRSQRSEVRGQKSEVRSQRSEVRGQRSKTRIADF